MSLDLLPNTSAGAVSDGLHAPARGTGSAAAGSCPHAVLGTPTSPAPGSLPPPQLLHGHFYPPKNVPPHPGTQEQVPSSPETRVISHPTQRAQPRGAAEAASWPGNGLLFPEEVARSQLGLGNRE